MTLNYNATGQQRKALVSAMADILERDAKYLGTPSMAYHVGCCTVSKSGEVSFDDSVNSEAIEALVEALAERGFVPAEPAPTAIEGEEIGLTIVLPAESVNVGNLIRLLEAKDALIKKALGLDALPVEVEDDRVLFPWFAVKPADDEIGAITHFITALCKMSVEQKRITATEKEVENEKYAFRCFLLHLGFIGSEYKTERKILLKNLSGSSAFKGGARHEISE